VHLFTRFGRGASAHGHSGLGLGLYSVRRVVEAHGGRVTLASEPGRGCTFMVELPLDRQARAQGPLLTDNRGD
jgi:two-component system OmpR family sensor kinase